MFEPLQPPPPDPVRVAVLADVQLYREGLARLIAGNPSLVVAGTGSTDRDSVVAVMAHAPTIVLVEASIASRPSFVPDLERLAPSIKVIAYGVLEDDEQALRCAEAGVAAFVPAAATGPQLVNVIEALARGEFSCPAHISAILLRRVRALAQDQRQAVVDHLTRREEGILALIADGLSNKEIAARLGVETCTVKNHVHHLLEKLHARSRTQAVARFRSLQASRGAERSSGSGP